MASAIDPELEHSLRAACIDRAWTAPITAVLSVQAIINPESSTRWAETIHVEVMVGELES